MIKLTYNVLVYLQIGYAFIYKDYMFKVHDIETYLGYKSIIIYVTDLNTNKLYVMRRNKNSNYFRVHDLYTYFKKYYIDCNFW